MFVRWAFSRLEIEGSGKVWKRDQKVRLRHVDTGGYLHSHNKKYTRLGGGQQEVSYLFVLQNFLLARIKRFDSELAIVRALDHSTTHVNYFYTIISLPMLSMNSIK